jgi:hypothetical protein
VGVGAGPLWTGYKSYISLIARRYSALQGGDWHTTSAKFLGISGSVIVLSKSKYHRMMFVLQVIYFQDCSAVH